MWTFETNKPEEQENFLTPPIFGSFFSNHVRSTSICHSFLCIITMLFYTRRNPSKCTNWGTNPFRVPKQNVGNSELLEPTAPNLRQWRCKAASREKTIKWPVVIPGSKYSNPSIYTSWTFLKSSVTEIWKVNNVSGNTCQKLILACGQLVVSAIRN